MRRSKYPTFPYSGSSCRLVPTLERLTPRYGRIYAELFLGRGNTFWPVLRRMQLGELSYQQIWVNDLRTMPFFHALGAHGGAIEIPERIADRTDRYTDFYARREAKKCGDPAALLLEPYLSRGGEGYGCGGAANPKANNIGRESYERNCHQASDLWNWARPIMRVDSCDWSQLDTSHMDWRDFMYFGTPYKDADNRAYDSDADMNFPLLVNRLLDAPYRWLFHGYEDELYMEKLGYPVEIVPIKKSVTDNKREGFEFFWTNFDITTGERVALPQKNATKYEVFSINQREKAMRLGRIYEHSSQQELDSTGDPDCGGSLLQCVEAGAERQFNQPSGDLRQDIHPVVSSHIEGNRVQLQQHRVSSPERRLEDAGCISTTQFFTPPAGDGTRQRAWFAPNPVTRFTVGLQINHPKFGTGTVLSSDDVHTVLRFGQDQRQLQTAFLRKLSINQA